MPEENEKPLLVRRGKVDSVDLYEVKEIELEALENGEPNGIYLNFAIFLLSLTFSSVLSLCTATFTKPIFQTLFLIIAVVGFFGGIFLLFLWWRGRKYMQSIIKKIKDRIPPSFIAQSSSSPIPSTDQITTTTTLPNG